MIQIEDHDMPITVADKIIKETDRFDVTEIKEIADYLYVYCGAHIHEDYMKGERLRGEK